MTRHSPRHRYVSAANPVAIIIALQEPFQLAHEVASSALELSRLAAGLGIDVVRTLVQTRTQASSSALLSEGRLRELARLTGGPGPVPANGRPPASPSEAPPDDERIDLVLFDGPLPPGQQRTLTRALGVEVVDRTGIILRTFERRARSREAKLQVALARSLYDAPRIRDDASLGDKEGGGGRGARGHSNVELAKQQNRARAAQLRRALADTQRQAETRRSARSELPKVSLVGYTNAGKSSLMRGLTGSSAFVHDAPFATLDLTVRALAPAARPRILVSDTVGFIKNLPHELVASFRATLDDAREAGLLLVVGDVSDREWRSQLHVTLATLHEVGAGDVPRLVLLNKADRLAAAERESIALELPDAVLLSAHDPAEVADLAARLVGHFEAQLEEASFVVPYADGGLLAEMHAEGQIGAAQHTSRGTRVTVRALSGHLSRWRRALGAGARQ